MEKKKSFRNKILPILLAAVVCIGTAAGFCAHNLLQGKTVSNTNDNGETFIKYGDKANILENIMDNNGKLVILEIVPFKNAGIMDMLVGTDKVINKINSDKDKLYNKYKNDKVTNGTVTTVKVSGKIASQHPFFISYDSSTSKYTVDYPNFFLDTIVDAATYPALYNYFADGNIEVRTVVAAELKETDLTGVSLVYVSSVVENKEIVSFNRYINGEIVADKTNDNQDNTDTGSFSKNGSAIKTSKATEAWYDDYVKNSSNTLISADMEWDMVESVVNFVYGGNMYSEGQPIPCVINYGSAPAKDTNVFKLITLLMKTTNEVNSTYDGMPTYYRTVLNSISKSGTNGNGRSTGVFTYNGKSHSNWGDTSVPLFDLQCTIPSEYVFNFVYKNNNNGVNSFFGMGSATPSSITDAGSAYLRGIVGEDTNKYTSANALGYLLGFEGAGEKKTIRVLEIEPCRDFMYYYNSSATDAEKKEVFKNILELGQALNMPEYDAHKMKSYSNYENLADKRFSFKCVTTAEFNGMNEDLVAYYDIIIMGSEYGTMPSNNNGPIYNDRKLDGYIYLAYGDLVKYNDRMAGMLPDEYVNISDYVKNNKVTLNNFTIDKQHNLKTTAWKDKKFVYSMKNAGVWAPLLINDLNKGDFYVLQSINKKFNGYSGTAEQFFNEKLGNARFSGNDITNKKLNELLNFVDIGRPVIMSNNLYNCVSANNKTAYPTSKVYSFVKNRAANANVISKSSISSSLLGIMHSNTLKITDYSIKYMKGNTLVDAPEIKYYTSDVYEGKKIDKYAGQIDDSCIIQNVEEFEYSVTFRSVPGTKYCVKLIVDKNTDGRFKSEPTVDDYNEVYYTKIFEATDVTLSANLTISLPENYNGMFTWQILVEELDARKNIVDTVSKVGYTVVKGEQKPIKVLQLYGYTNKKEENLIMSDPSGNFYKLIDAAKDSINYSIDVTYMHVDDFEDEFNGNKYIAGTSYNTSADYLKSNGYNMLVIGFADSYNLDDISDDNGALSCVLDFMKNGNSVLFSHDTMQFQPSANAGITYTNDKNGKIKITTTDEWGERGGYIMTNAMRDLVGMDRYSATTIKNTTDPAIMNAANIPYDVNGNYIREIQGFSDWFLLWFNMCTNYQVTRPSSGLYTLVPVKGMETCLKNSTPLSKGYTTLVEEINRGQISMYPFDTTTDDGTLKVATTHNQYYQLDLEDDEVVVWYTLAPTNNAPYYKYAQRDAANTYYIYSKGNITYSGAGHDPMTEISELKLFLNTVIRAAVAGNFAPVVEVNNASTTKVDTEYVMFPVFSETDKTIYVQFTAKDEDLATRKMLEETYDTNTEVKNHIGRFKAAKIYWVDDNGVEKVIYDYAKTSEPLLNAEMQIFEVYDPFAGLTGAALQTEYNNSSELLRNMHDCYMQYIDEGLSRIVIEAVDHHNEKGRATVKLIQQELFPLD